MKYEKYPDVLIEALKKRIDALDNIVAENTKAIRYDISKLFETTAFSAEVSARHHSDLTVRLCRLEKDSKDAKEKNMSDNLDVVGMGEKQKLLNKHGWYFRERPSSIQPVMSECLENLIEFSFGLYGQACRNKERIDELEKKLGTALETIGALESFAQKTHLDNLEKKP